jgi:hypothetical protein
VQPGARGLLQGCPHECGTMCFGGTLGFCTRWQKQRYCFGACAASKLLWQDGHRQVMASVALLEAAKRRARSFASLMERSAHCEMHFKWVRAEQVEQEWIDWAWAMVSVQMEHSAVLDMSS